MSRFFQEIAEDLSCCWIKAVCKNCSVSRKKTGFQKERRFIWKFQGKQFFVRVTLFGLAELVKGLDEWDYVWPTADNVS